MIVRMSEVDLGGTYVEPDYEVLGARSGRVSRFLG